MRLIDADELKASIPETETDIFENCQRCTTLMDYEVKDLINAQPTIPASPRWVRCEERLPDEVGSYLVYAPTYIGGSSSAKECKAGVMFARWLKGGHWSIEVGYYKRLGCVTHWMPIEPPKEDA